MEQLVRVLLSLLLSPQLLHDQSNGKGADPSPLSWFSRRYGLLNDVKLDIFKLFGFQ